MATHSEERPFSCVLCPESFTLDTCAVAGKQPFLCHLCPAAFSENCKLVAHLRTHTGERPFSCSHCDASFKLRGSLIAHMRTHTGQRPFSCVQFLIVGDISEPFPVMGVSASETAFLP
nr:gastrula zinc finger protein XlCGF71.1-like [Rhipicephalus microplus]